MENILLLKFLLQPVRFWKSPSKVDVSECGSCDNCSVLAFGMEMHEFKHYSV